MILLFLLVFLSQGSFADYPSCLDKSQRVFQVDFLARNSVISDGINSWNDTLRLSSLLYTQGVQLATSPSAHLAVGYVNGNFLAIEDCTVQENTDLPECEVRSVFRYRVLLLLQGMPDVVAYNFDESTLSIIGNGTEWIFVQPTAYVVTQRPWWGVRGWSEPYFMRNGKQGRTYGSCGGEYCVVSVYVPSEGICPNLETALSSTLGTILGTVIMAALLLCCSICCALLGLRRARQRERELQVSAPPPHENEVLLAIAPPASKSSALASVALHPPSYSAAPPPDYDFEVVPPPEAAPPAYGPESPREPKR